MIHIDADIIPILMLIMVRVSVFVMLMPILGQKIIPTSVKVGLTIMLTAILFPIVKNDIDVIPLEPLSIALMGAKEIFLGATLALSAQLVFGAVQFAGQLISYQMGLSAANIFDPSSSEQVSVVGQVINTLAILVWFAVGAHHLFIQALMESFTVSPIGGDWAIGGIEGIIHLGSSLFLIGMQLAAPVMILVFLINAGLGLVSKAVPQIQVFFVSFPLTIGFGLMVLALSLPAMLSIIAGQFRYFGESIPSLMRVVGGG